MSSCSIRAPTGRSCAHRLDVPVDASLVELRGMAPRDLIDVLDAVSVARRISRTELVVEVLRAWANERIHEATVIARVAGINPAPTETERKPPP